MHQLKQDIRRIDREITSARSRRDTLRQALRTAELRLGELQRDIQENRAAISSSEADLEALEQRRKALQQARGEQQDRVREELRAIWQMGGDAHIKVLLNQQEPHTLSRMMRYYRYFLGARTALLDRYRQTLLELDRVQAEIDSGRQRLAEQREALQERQAQLARTQDVRKQAVASLSADIASKGSQLQQLERDQGKLEELLKAIEEAVINLQVPENYQAFASARGKMPWPLKGKPSNRYGKYRNEGKMRWQGLTIPAREGTPVQAIHHGRVVYADWFRGSGLLLIIDHGEGYMSLYANNQSLLREVGEWVTGGTPISTVGSSGGLDKPALYFEIRHNGKPTNPAVWCRG